MDPNQSQNNTNTTPPQPPPIQVPPPPQPSVTPIPPAKPIPPKNNTTLAVLLLLFLNPVGVIYMWLKTSWSLLAKILITFFSFIFVIIPGSLAIIILLTINPIGMINKAKDAQRIDKEIKERTTQEINSVKQNNQFSSPTNIPTIIPTSILSVTPSASLVPTNSNSTILLPNIKSPTPQANGNLEIKIIRKDDSKTFISFTGILQNLLPKRFYDLNACVDFETNCSKITGYIIKTDNLGNSTINNQLGEISNSFISSNTIIKITEEVINPSDTQTCPTQDAACLEGKFVAN